MLVRRRRPCAPNPVQLQLQLHLGRRGLAYYHIANTASGAATELPTMSPRCAAALGNQLGSRAPSDWVDWRAEKRLLINSRAHICSCQHIICQELGAPFASTSVFSYSISAQHGQNHRNRDFYGWFLSVQFFVFDFLWSVAAAAAAATPVASRHTTAVGSCNISINNINNRQSPTPSAGRTFGLHFLLAQITLDVILLPPSV